MGGQEEYIQIYEAAINPLFEALIINAALCTSEYNQVYDQLPFYNNKQFNQ